ncbi:ATP-binding response regulator [Acidomonas methanolica]|uniref:ATP-binding response regulator n=1 Tax=Acidomonas methanolica TaxID=437 RepID=UPI00211A8980|nr:response regulator [Acidomonas methanolica]MCQ9155499.1 response regulator [Acidomonas methanolica]
MREHFGYEPNERSRILLLDDEAEILVALTDLLEDEFDILISTDPVEALETLRRTPDVAVIVSDQRMPGMTGDQFLHHARAFSDAHGILLTGYADLAAVVAALNQGRIRFYAHKPWDSDALRAMIREVAYNCRVERALLTERALLRGLMEASPLGLSFSDANGRCIRRNIGPERGGDARVTVHERDLFPHVSDETYREMCRRTVENGHYEHLCEIERGGSRRWQEFTRSTLPWPRRPDGEIVPSAERWQVCMVRDVTERMALEARLRQDDKMRALGTLSGGIAHDFNNLLTAIIGSLELLADMVPPEGVMAARLLENASEAAKRGTLLTRRLLEFGRPKSSALQPVAVGPLIRGMEDLLVQSLNRHMTEDGRPTGRCTLDMSGVAENGTLPMVMSDPGQLEMALLNLCINARDAMPQGGSVAISSRAERAAPDGPVNVVITVADQGCGMSADTAARIFEPFFTTKGIGSGTGLGLSTIYSFLRRCNGDVRVDSRPGEGTRMSLWLPVCESCRALDAVSETVPRAVLPPCRILVVDDEDSVRLVTEHFLRQDGHDVVTARDGAEALALVENGERFDLVVLDLMMPGMSGRECGEALARVAPSLPVLYVSGYADPGSLPGDAFVLDKPFTPQTLRAALVETLSAPGRGTPHMAAASSPARIGAG